MIQKPRPYKGFLLTSTSLGALNPLHEMKLALLMAKNKNQLFTTLLCSRAVCLLGLERAEVDKIWVCRMSLSWLCFLLYLDDVDKEH